jgi:hypothetical protein
MNANVNVFNIKVGKLTGLFPIVTQMAINEVSCIVSFKDPSLKASELQETEHDIN